MINQEYSYSFDFPRNDNKSYRIHRLSEFSNEYFRLYQLMQGEFNRRTIEIFKIENNFLFAQYQLNVLKTNFFNSNTIIKELVHCTSMFNVQSIIEYNFDWRRTRRAKYGYGVSFSTKPEYANLQSCLQNGTHRAMFIVDVIIGNKRIGNKYTQLPEWPYDTTVNQDETVFVKYYDNEFYPKYVICYITYPVASTNGERYLVK